MQKNSYNIRTMTRQEVDIAIDWAAAEGWNPGLCDADCFYAADPNGFLIGLVDDEPVATLSAVKYGESFGFLGLYIVKPEYRGRGCGIRIWNAGLAYLKGRTIGLDGVVAQQDNHKKYGFTLAYKNIRYRGTGGGHFSSDSGIVPLSTVSFDEIAAYDKPFFPEDRTKFLNCWINQPRIKALGVLRNRKLAGYGVMRMCRSGYKVGPLFADSEELADRLFSALKANAEEGAPILLDTPEANAAAAELVKRHNMAVVFETVRMYRENKPVEPLDQLFGITTFELG
ncbi:MAG: GNAT family N-acetyltransferase [Gammaproteobacteria bacterium]